MVAATVRAGLFVALSDARLQIVDGRVPPPGHGQQVAHAAWVKVLGQELAIDLVLYPVRLPSILFHHASQVQRIDVG